MPGQTKPRSGAQVDWGHPLARGLVFATLGEQELVAGVAPTQQWSYGKARQPTPQGEGWYQNATNQRAFLGYTKPAVMSTMTVDFTIVVCMQPVALENDSMFFNIPPGTGIGDPYQTLGFARNGSTSALAGFYYDGSARRQITSDTGGIQITDPMTQYAVTRQQTNGVFYRNGLQHGAGKTWANSSAVVLSTQPISLMSYSSTHDQNAVQGPCLYAYAWARALSAAEMARLAAEPYAFLAKPGPKIYWIPTSTNATVNATTLAATVTFPAPGVSAGTGATSLAATASFPSAGLSAGVGATVLAGVGTFPAPSMDAAASPAALAASVAMQTAGISAGVGADVLSGTVSFPAPSVESVVIPIRRRYRQDTDARDLLTARPAGERGRKSTWWGE